MTKIRRKDCEKAEPQRLEARCGRVYPRGTRPCPVANHRRIFPLRSFYTLPPKKVDASNFVDFSSRYTPKMPIRYFFTPLYKQPMPLVNPIPSKNLLLLAPKLATQPWLS
jgi:hypothetical protein